jgi:hypothetical protein
MNQSAQRLWNRFSRLATAAASLSLGLAGSAGAAGIDVAAPQAEGGVHVATFAAAGGGIDLGVQLFVGAVLLIAAACFAGLLYLMVSCPPEDDEAEASASAAESVDTVLQLLPGAASQPGAEGGLERSLGQLFRAWLGGRLGHPGPM